MSNSWRVNVGFGIYRIVETGHALSLLGVIEIGLEILFIRRTTFQMWNSWWLDLF